jgi:prevent-host-death family protein
MTTIGVARLKANLSEVLSRVRHGEAVVVTDHGTPIARITPVIRVGSDADRILDELARQGLVSLGERVVSEEYWTMTSPEDPTGASLDALKEERRTGR